MILDGPISHLHPLEITDDDGENVAENETEVEVVICCVFLGSDELHCDDCEAHTPCLFRTLNDDQMQVDASKKSATPANGVEVPGKTATTSKDSQNPRAEDAQDKQAVIGKTRNKSVEDHHKSKKPWSDRLHYNAGHRNDRGPGPNGIKKSAHNRCNRGCPDQRKRPPGQQNVNAPGHYSQCMPSDQTIYGFRVETLLNQIVDLSQYRGQVVLIVNVATFCSLTQQYLDFAPLIEQNIEHGFTVVAFPCNQFAYQEPARNDELINGISYVRPGNGFQPHQNLHIYGKLEVNGENQHELYGFLKSVCPQTTDEIGQREYLMWDPIRPNDITWNFEKFLVDRRGRVRFRFHPTAWANGTVVQPFLQQILAETR